MIRKIDRAEGARAIARLRARQLRGLGILLLLGIVLVVGCQRDALLGPTGEATLSVKVALRSLARGFADTTATIDQIRVRAVELKAGSEAVRASRELAIGADDETWSVVLRVPPSDRYRVEVEMTGSRDFGEGRVTEHGLLFAGESELNNLLADTDRLAEVLLDDVVPRSVEIAGGVAGGYHLSWSAVGGAVRYRVKEQRPGSDPRELTIEGRDFPIEFGGLRRGAALDRQAYRVAAELSRGRVSAFSESVGVTVPTVPSVVTDLTATVAGIDSVILSWTAPGDEDGQVASYDLRGGLGPITVESFPQAGAIPGTPVPGPAGRVERVVLAGLLPDSRYYFALRSADNDQNISALSNVAEAVTGSLPALCELSADSLDFGDVPLGETAERTALVRNAGGSLLAGAIALDCVDASFAILDGAGAFSLGAGESRNVRVRFAPNASGPHSCALATGLACGPITLLGRSTADPSCAVDHDRLDFSLVPIGDAGILSFEVSNVGSGTLVGSIPDRCDDSAFSVIEGAGPFALEAGIGRVVRVRYAPVTPGENGCALSLGSGCGAIDLLGRGDLPPACFVAPRSIDFDPIEVGESEARSFRIRNLGGGVLRGSVALACTDSSFVLSAGGGDYELLSSEEHEVTVTFTPLREALHHCEVTTGSSGCLPVTLTARTLHAPICGLAPDRLEFAPLNVGESDEKTFLLRNDGEGLLKGTVFAGEDPNFAIIEGAGDYSLSANQSRTVRVRFNPIAAGSFSYPVDAGSACGVVGCTGSADFPPLCSLSADSLEFAQLVVGDAAERSFTIGNKGGGLLEGAVDLDCASSEFSLLSGAGSYALAHGDQVVVTLRYAPLDEGSDACAITTDCGDVTANGGAVWPLSCSLSADTLRFDPIPRGTSAEQSFSLSNTGQGTLSGVIELACANSPFSITSGAGAYSLGPAAQRMITVRFAPTTFGAAQCLLTTGAPCGDVELFGATLPEPGCELSTDRLDFPPTEIGQTSDLPLTIQNTGGGTLSGTVALDCSSPVWSLVAGAGDFELGAGESHAVTLRFAPVDQVRANCRVSLGSRCALVDASGIGFPPPVCTLTPDSLDFGPLLINTTKILSFEVRNTGGGILAGTVPASCGEPTLTLVGGVGDYELAAGQAHLVQVQFAPVAAGVKTCDLVFGEATGCGSIKLSGEGLLPPECSVPIDTLDFGAILVGEQSLRSFEIENTGLSPFSGFVSLSCASPDFAITGGAGAFSLGPNETHFVALRYQANDRGSDACELLFGPGSGCQSVSLTGKGELPAHCELSDDSLDFDLVGLGEEKLLSFTIGNSGDRPLIGAITKDCVDSDFEIETGEGSFLLGNGDSRLVRVRFKPQVNGTHSCTIATGVSECPSVTLSAFTQYCVQFPAEVELWWNDAPVDLDLHLWTPQADGIRYHVFYGERGLADELPFATLDLDDQDGFGPERLTLHQTWPFDGEYALAVDHFVGEGALATSGAFLRVKSADGTSRDFAVPTNDGRPNLWWDFARLDRSTGCLTILNALRSDPPVETFAPPPKAAR